MVYRRAYPLFIGTHAACAPLSANPKSDLLGDLSAGAHALVWRMLAFVFEARDVVLRRTEASSSRDVFVARLLAPNLWEWHVQPQPLYIHIYTSRASTTYDVRILYAYYTATRLTIICTARIHAHSRMHSYPLA